MDLDASYTGLMAPNKSLYNLGARIIFLSHAGYSMMRLPSSMSLVWPQYLRLNTKSCTVYVVLDLPSIHVSWALSPFWTYKKERSLSLIITNQLGPSAATGVENLKLVATITNTGAETVEVLNDPRSLLSKRPSNKFSITDVKGRKPAFTGVKVKYSPEAAAKLGAYTVLAPGTSISVTHDLSEGYNFTSSGVGIYDFEADNTFYVVKDNNEIAVVRAQESAVLTASITGNLAVARREESGLSKRATFVSCTAARQTTLNTAIASAETYAANAYSYVNGLSVASTRYTTWFGAYTSARRSTVLSHFKNIDSNNFSSFTYDCSYTDSSYAYVYPSQFGKIYLCSAFWNAPNTGTDSRAGTIVHESSHFTSNGGTDDYAYGQTAAKSLANSSPAKAIMNADSHEYFVENNPVLA